MNITQEHIERSCPEYEIYNSVLPLDGSRILELGCGRADLTRAIASDGRDRKVFALEVDEQQHSKNLKIDDLPNVIFALAGAEDIPYEECRFDIVMMFYLSS